MSLREVAVNYVPSQTVKNVSELESISVDVDIIMNKVFNVGKENEFKADVIMKLNKEEEEEFFRVPKTVIAQVQTMLENKPDFDMFKVSRKGNTKENTTYQVIPL